MYAVRISSEMKRLDPLLFVFIRKIRSQLRGSHQVSTILAFVVQRREQMFLCEMLNGEYCSFDVGGSSCNHARPQIRVCAWSNRGTSSHRKRIRRTSESTDTSLAYVNVNQARTHMCVWTTELTIIRNDNTHLCVYMRGIGARQPESQRIN